MDTVLPQAVIAWSGHLGVVVYLGSYAALQAGLLRGNGYAYALCNMVGAIFILISMSEAFNMSAAVIQVFWIVISLFGLIRFALLHSWIRFTTEERALIEQAFQDMPHPAARRFLDRGQWIDAQPGQVLTREGTPVETLAYLLEGEVEVMSEGKVLAQPTRGFIGEMNVMTGGEASACVRVSRPSRIFTITRDALRKMARRDGDFGLLLENALSRDTRRKLLAANRRLSSGSKASTIPPPHD